MTNGTSSWSSVLLRLAVHLAAVVVVVVLGVVAFMVVTGIVVSGDPGAVIAVLVDWSIAMAVANPMLVVILAIALAGGVAWVMWPGSRDPVVKPDDRR